MFDRLMQAHDIVRDLQEWLEDANEGHCEDYATELTARMNTWCDVITIEIEGMTLYNSEFNDDCDLTFAFCKQEFVGICNQLQRFTKEVQP